MEKSKLMMRCRAVQSGMALNVQVSMCRTEPENYIRNIRGLQKLGNQLGENGNESTL